MLDGFGRKITYLRLSVTDRCNLRCAYCMPKGGLSALPHSEILSFEEIERFVRLTGELGITKVRLTGGEPLVRKNIIQPVKMLSALPKVHFLGMTTNGILLAEYASELKKAGLSGVNVSLDTMNPNHFERISGGGDLRAVLSGIDAGAAAGLTVKLNCVPVRGYNDDDMLFLCEYAASKKIDLRFIELMPIGEGVFYEGISSKNLIGVLSGEFGEPVLLKGENSPAVYYQFPKLQCRIGFIQPISECFCADCNRIRLTSDGFLKLCLHHQAGIDIKTPLRSGMSDEQIKKLIEEAVLKKPAAHNFTGGIPDFEKRCMTQIGG